MHIHFMIHLGFDKLNEIHIVHIISFCIFADLDVLNNPLPYYHFKCTVQNHMLQSV